jgi:hypothetical protein
MQSNESLQADLTKLKLLHVGLDSLVQKEFDNLRQRLNSHSEKMIFYAEKRDIAALS